MKINKYLMPMLGIAALSGSIVPMVSCSKETPEEPNPENDFLYEQTEAGRCTITKFIGNSDTAVIPADARVGDLRLKIVSISPYAFSDTRVKHVLLGENIETIYDHAFTNCVFLQKVDFNAKLQNIGEFAFSRTPIFNVDLTNTNVVDITKSCFESCPNLNSVLLPNFQSIGESAFRWCPNLTEVTCKGTFNGSISKYAFQDCKNLALITIPRCKNIYEEAFSGCTSLSHINWSTGLETIAKYAFNNCVSLKEIHIPKETTTIEPTAFAGCTNLIKITINENNSKYRSGDWNDCIIDVSDRDNQKLIVGLKTTYIPVGSVSGEGGEFNTIAAGAFTNLSLNYLHIPKNITKLEPGFIKNCDIKTMSVDPGNTVYSTYFNRSGSEEEYKDANCIFKNVDGGLSIFYAYGSPDYEYLSECVPDKPLISIEDYAFSYTNKSMSVEIPDSIVHIAHNAFYECPHVEFKHESSKTIDTEHFKGTRYFDEQTQETRGYLIRKDENNEFGGNILYKVYGGVVPETERYSQIGEFAYDNIQYDELTIPSNVKIFDKACFGKAEIGKLILNAGTNTNPATLRDISFSTDCRIGTMKIGKNIKITADSGHLGLENVKAKEIIFEQGIKNISSHALYTNHYVENVNLPNSITSISPFAFYSCINLKHINIPGTASKLGVKEGENEGFVFTNAQKLSEIDLTGWGSTLPTVSESGWTDGNKSFAGLPETGTIYITDETKKDDWIEILSTLGLEKINNWTFEVTQK